MRSSDKQVRPATDHLAPSAFRIWCWPNFLCLDAPIIAGVWWIAFSLSFGGKMEPAIGGALFVAVWAIYLADRLIDVQRIQDWSIAPDRHRFAKQHLGWLRGLLGFAIGTGSTLAFWILPKTIALLGIGIGFGVATYFFCFVLRKAPTDSRSSRLGKEFVCGFLFSVGTVAGQSAVWESVGSGWIAVLLFGAVCSFNCLLISANERETDSVNDPAAATHRWRTLLRDLRPLGIMLIAFIVVAFFFSPETKGIWLALLGSQSLLLLLREARAKISPTTFRLLVDVALLTPLFIYPWLLTR